MNLLSKPEGYQTFWNNEFMEFGLFKLFITRRSWVGDTYVGSEERMNYLKELREQQEIVEIFEIEENTPTISMIVDASVFKGKTESLESILEFLEEVDDLEGEERKTQKNVQMRYWKKLKAYGDKIENHPYLLRWCANNKTHSFCKPLEDHLTKVRDIKVNKLVKSIDKELDVIESKHRKLWMKHPMGYEGQINQGEKDLEKVQNFFRTEADKYISLTLKYVWSESNLLYFSVHIIRSFFKVFEEKALEKISDFITLGLADCHYIISVTKVRYKNVVSFLSLPRINYQTGEIYNYDENTFIDYKTHLLEYFTENRKHSKTIQTLFSYESSKGKEPLEIGVLKEIVRWASLRINELIPSNLFNLWSHEIVSDYFNELAIEEIKFVSQSIVAGPRGDELSLLAVALVEAWNGEERELHKVYFPILDVDSWEGLDVHQCALMAYATCLYHDILSGNAYKLLTKKITEDNNQGFGTQYKLVFDKQIEKVKQSKTSKKLRTRNGSTKERVMKGHWVSFHFRRQRSDFIAGEAVQNTAKKYGFRHIPRGYTFVDTFFKGGNKDEMENIKVLDISALEVLSKTLTKTKYIGNKAGEITEMAEQEAN